MATLHKIGRRKSAIARIYMNAGSGNITINGKDFATYFPTATLQYKLQQPFLLTETVKQFDLNISVSGGGTTGQVEAIRLATSRALCEISQEHRKALKPEGLLTRDARVVERKKFGQKKARKRFQFSKR